MLSNFMGHLRTILHHKKLVFIHCCKCGIVWQGLVHDMSKFSPTEFFQGVKYFQGNRSPNAKERELFGYSKAWMHHKGRNKHHFEYWTDYNIKARNVMPVEMPVKYVVEMLCDRMAASKTYLKKDYTQKSSLDYYMNSTAKRHNLMHPETDKLLHELLLMLYEKGEKETFKYAKKLVKQSKNKSKI